MPAAPIRPGERSRPCSPLVTRTYPPPRRSSTMSARSWRTAVCAVSHPLRAGARGRDSRTCRVGADSVTDRRGMRGAVGSPTRTDHAEMGTAFSVGCFRCRERLGALRSARPSSPALRRPAADTMDAIQRQRCMACLTRRRSHPIPYHFSNVFNENQFVASAFARRLPLAAPRLSSGDGAPSRAPACGTDGRIRR